MKRAFLCFGCLFCLDFAYFGFLGFRMNHRVRRGHRGILVGIMDREFREEERGLWASADSSERWVALARSHWREGRLWEAYRAFQNAWVDPRDPEIQKLTTEMASLQEPYLGLLPESSRIGLSSSLFAFNSGSIDRREVAAGTAFFDTLTVNSHHPFNLQVLTDIPFLKNFEFTSLNSFTLKRIEKYLTREHKFVGHTENFETIESLTTIAKLPCQKSISIELRHDLLELLKSTPFDPRRDQLRINAAYLDDHDILSLKTISALKSLSSDNANLSAEGIMSLAQLTQLEHLRLSSDSDWSKWDFPLEKFDKLVYLDLSDCQLSKHHLSGIGLLTQLRVLVLDGIPSFTPDDFSFLRSLKQLLMLSLKRVSSFGVAALEHLRGLTQLEELYLKGTPVTENALNSLELPSLWIVLGQNFHFIKE